MCYIKSCKLQITSSNTKERLITHTYCCSSTKPSDNVPTVEMKVNVTPGMEMDLMKKTNDVACQDRRPTITKMVLDKLLR